jgi:hypothetical protein
MAEPAHLVDRDDGRMPRMGRREATVEDLYREPKKAELVNGELVVMTPGGGTHGYAAGRIFAGLLVYGDRTGTGVAIGDNVGFLVSLPNRRSFSPDAAFWTGGPLTEKFFEGARRSPRRSEVPRTTARPPNARWRRREPTTSPPGRWWCGTWTCAPAA